MILWQAVADKIHQARPDMQMYPAAKVSVERWQPNWISSATYRIAIVNSCRPSDNEAMHHFWRHMAIT
jgi:hypothetical protein